MVMHLCRKPLDLSYEKPKHTLVLSRLIIPDYYFPDALMFKIRCHTEKYLGANYSIFIIMVSQFAFIDKPVGMENDGEKYGIWLKKL